MKNKMFDGYYNNIIGFILAFFVSIASKNILRKHNTVLVLPCLYL